MRLNADTAVTTTTKQKFMKSNYIPIASVVRKEYSLNLFIQCIGCRIVNRFSIKWLLSVAIVTHHPIEVVVKEFGYFG